MLVAIRFFILTGQAVGYAFPQLVACFPEGAARYKLEAIMRHWETQIDQTNLEVLVLGFEDLKKEPAAGPEADGVREVFDGLCGCLLYTSDAADE